MDRRLLKSFGSEPGFFSIGLTAADLKSAGTIPVDSEEWMMVDMRGNRQGRQDLTRTVGKGSSWQVDGLDSATTKCPGPVIAKQVQIITTPPPYPIVHIWCLCRYAVFCFCQMWLYVLRSNVCS